MPRSKGQRIFIPSYCANPGGLVSGGTTANATIGLLSMWKTATNTKLIEIYRIVATMGGGAAGFASFRGCHITTVDSGGTTITAAPLNRAQAASSLASTTGSIRAGAYTNGTRSTDMFAECFGGSNTGQQYILFNAQSAGDRIKLRPSVAEGFEIRAVIGATAQTTASQFGVTVWWTETDD